MLILPTDVIELSKSLPFCKSLMRLDLRNNPLIGTEGYSCLAEAMKRNHTLAFLEIDVSVIMSHFSVTLPLYGTWY